MFVTFLCVVLIALAGAAYGGPPALSSDKDVMLNTYWTKANFKNDTRGISLKLKANLWGVYLETTGLNATESSQESPACYSKCFMGSPCSWSDFSACGVNSNTDTCADASGALNVTAIVTLIACVTKLSAGWKRLKPETDSGFEKCKGIISSIVPMVTNLAALSTYRGACYAEFLDKQKYPAVQDAELGPGFTVFTLSLCLNAVCAVIHIVTPVPVDAPDSCAGESKQPEGTATELSTEATV